MDTAMLIRAVRFVVEQNGQPTAVQMDMDTWNALLDWMEESEDRVLVRSAIARLRTGPQEAGAPRWEDVREEWDTRTSESES